MQTVNDLIQHWLAARRQALERGETSAAALREPVRLCGKLAEVFGYWPVVELKPLFLIRWVDDHAGWSKDMKRQVVALVSAIFNQALDDGLIDRNPIRGARRVFEDAGGRPASAAEFRAMLRACHASYFRRFIVFVRICNCSYGEARQLRWRDVAGEWAELPDWPTAARTRQKRRLYLPPVAVKLLDWIRRHEPPREHVLLNSHKEKWGHSAVFNWLLRLKSAAGIPGEVALYDLMARIANEPIPVRPFEVIDLPQAVQLPPAEPLDWSPPILPEPSPTVAEPVVRRGLIPRRKKGERHARA